MLVKAITSLWHAISSGAFSASFLSTSVVITSTTSCTLLLLYMARCAYSYMKTYVHTHRVHKKWRQTLKCRHFAITDRTSKLLVLLLLLDLMLCFVYELVMVAVVVVGSATAITV